MEGEGPGWLGDCLTERLADSDWLTERVADSDWLSECALISGGRGGGGTAGMASGRTRWAGRGGPEAGGGETDAPSARGRGGNAGLTRTG